MSSSDDALYDTLPPSQDPAAGNDTRDPPRTFFGVLRCLGPGLIIAGSVVGSGELIATTKTGAEAGISLLWLVIIGCVIKVFVQIELGRYTISHGETTLAALDRVPGPRLRVNWIVWFWLAMMLVIQAQLGAIVGGVGQAMAIAFPITGDYVRMLELPSVNELTRYIGWQEDFAQGRSRFRQLDDSDQSRILKSQKDVQRRLELAGDRGTEALAAGHRLVTLRQAAKLAAAENSSDTADVDGELLAASSEIHRLVDPPTWDDRYWAVVITLMTIAMLYRGKYGLVQNLATTLVVGFTAVTVGNVISLQTIPQWHLSAEQLAYGLSFHFPTPTLEIPSPLITALAAFGIIGVGASELIAYPYWCLEKGYARYAGVRSDSADWGPRARGWMRVMHCDALASMVIYTIATVAFFLMGVAVLHSQGLNPENMRMVGTLLEQYVPVFGKHARLLFLIGAFAVLYSTFLVANAGNARMFTDGLKVFGLVDRHKQSVHDRLITFFCVLLPLSNLALYWTGANPVQFVLLAGTMQALMLPMLGVAALYFRYRMSDRRLAPGKIWDTLLAVSCLGLFVAGGYLAYDSACRLWGLLG